MMESRYWRAELKTELKELNELRHFVRWSEKRQILFERKAMLVAFQIRSLLERPKVSRKIAKSNIRVVQFPATESTPLDKILGDISAMYDWEAGENFEMPVMQFCNQIIHYKYMYARSEVSKLFTEMVLVSDYKMPKGIFKVDIDNMISLFNKFTTDDSGLDREGVSSSITWNESKSKYVVNMFESD